MNDKTRYLQVIEDGPHAGWMRYRPEYLVGYVQTIGVARFRAESDSVALVEIDTDERTLNTVGTIHGGFLAAFADHAFFAAMHAFAPGSGFDAITVDMTCQFMKGAVAGEPLRARVERMHETGRLLFLRIDMRQQDRAVAHFTGTIRKSGRSR